MSHLPRTLQQSLPDAFCRQMQDMLPPREYDAFLQTYSEPATRGLRVNTLKTTPSALTNAVPFALKPIPWCETGFYYKQADRPGRHPYHHAGVYYIQEPSAMAVVELLDPHPGEKILDLCAAPGGKSTHISAKLAGDGWLVSNEIHPQRAKVLADNIERCGVPNATVLNAAPDELTDRFPAYFDRIIVDAPCSGEGMFRKNPEAIGEWGPEAVDHCVQRQLDILRAALPMLRPGGRLVYSTCTFNDRENEGVVTTLLQQFPELRLLGESCAPFADQTNDSRAAIERHALVMGQSPENGCVFRLWPHHLRGEGHFVAMFEKREEQLQSSRTTRGQHKQKAKKKAKSGRTLDRGQRQLLDTFIRETLQLQAGTRQTQEGIRQTQAGIRQTQVPAGTGNYVLYGNHLYATSSDLPPLDGIKVVRPGLYLGEFKKNRFEPSHAWAMALKATDVQRTVALTEKERQHIDAYLRGETLSAEQSNKGWVLVTADHFPLGWGKQDGTQVKNHLPKHLRLHTRSQ
ncbi:RsmB/NOP family class I SAM-dependent RNA methyltransferase [Numidum massiliense]|uniref:RsmB/NOP family class I SAM-dependent RNA methyltransferase n=1 Tax=Numidum massiliense TaxID=1522315 RepID=UPI0006D569F5|nr:RsmF rRNA methyltransferase first C-terminal domain-containing protein [Numidum massiliense]